MLLFLLAAAVLALLAYYTFGGSTATRPDAPTSAPDKAQSRDRPNDQRRPRIHAKKVENTAVRAFQSARGHVDTLKEKDALPQIARDAYVLSETLEEMFASDQFFGAGRRVGSFHTAIQAAEQARDRLIERQRETIGPTDLPAASATRYVGDKYVRNATESALMVAWCAGGLIGKSRHESARKAFRVPVSPEDVQSWERFGQVLQRESAHYMVDPSSET